MKQNKYLVKADYAIRLFAYAKTPAAKEKIVSNWAKNMRMAIRHDLAMRKN